MIAFAFVASGSGYCILKMNNFMQLLILLLFMDRGACTGTGVRNSFQADASGGGDQRRRKPWQEWKYIGPPNFAPNEWPEDPPSWLKFAKNMALSMSGDVNSGDHVFTKEAYIEKQYIENLVHPLPMRAPL